MLETDIGMKQFHCSQSEELLVLDEVAATIMQSIHGPLRFLKFGEQILSSNKYGLLSDTKMANGHMDYKYCFQLFLQRIHWTIHIALDFIHFCCEEHIRNMSTHILSVVHIF